MLTLFSWRKKQIKRKKGWRLVYDLKLWFRSKSKVIMHIFMTSSAVVNSNHKSFAIRLFWINGEGWKARQPSNFLVLYKCFPLRLHIVLYMVQSERRTWFVNLWYMGFLVSWGEGPKFHSGGRRGGRRPRDGPEDGTYPLPSCFFNCFWPIFMFLFVDWFKKTKTKLFFLGKYFIFSRK